MHGTIVRAVRSSNTNMAPSRKAQRILEFILLRRQRKRRAQYWIHPLNIERLEYGEYHRLCYDTRQDIFNSFE